MKADNFAVLVILSVLLCACSHTSRISQTTQSEFYAEFNRYAEGRKGYVELATGQKVSAKNIQVTSDSSSWVILDTGLKQGVPTKQINEVRFKNHGKAAGQGFGIGLLVGALAGLGALLQFPCCGEEDPGAFPLIVIGGAALGVGTVVGLPIGAAIGSKDKFIFASSEKN